LEWQGIAGHRPYVYYLWQNDLNGGQQDSLPQVLPTIPTTFRYNSGYVGAGSSGSIGPSMVYRSELAWEYGTTLSNPADYTIPPPFAVPQVNDSISAGAAVVGLETSMISGVAGRSGLRMPAALRTAPQRAFLCVLVEAAVAAVAVGCAAHLTLASSNPPRVLVGQVLLVLLQLKRLQRRGRRKRLRRRVTRARRGAELRASSLSLGDASSSASSSSSSSSTS
jgi:hypothetical protein